MEEREENRLLEKERMCGVSVDSHLWGYRLERVCVSQGNRIETT